MPVMHSRSPAWLWGVYLGLFTGGGVILLATLRYGFRSELLLVGGLLVLVFAIMGLFSGLVDRYTAGGPT